MTRKELANNYKVYKVGYCDLQYLLRCCDIIGSNSGVYGWNWDAYKISDNIAICTGYRSLTGESIDTDIIDKYEDKAKAIYKDYSLKYEEMQAKIKKLLSNFIKEIAK